MRADSRRASAPGPDLFSLGSQELRSVDQNASLKEKKKREKENVSSLPSVDVPAAPRPPDPPPVETRRDARLSPEGGGEPEPPPPPRPADSRRLDEARRLQKRLLDEHGYDVRPNADRSAVEPVPIAHLRRHLDEPDPELWARFAALRPELLALALGGPAVANGSKPPPAARDPGHPLEAAEAMIRDDRDPGFGGRLLAYLAARWQDRPNEQTRDLFDDLAELLPRERVLRRVREADAKTQPARWFASAIAEDLGAIRRRSRVERGHRPLGQRASKSQGPVERASA